MNAKNTQNKNLNVVVVNKSSSGGGRGNDALGAKSGVNRTNGLHRQTAC